MSARDNIVYRITRHCSAETAEQLVNALVAEVRREDAVRLLDERRNHVSRAIFCDGIKHAADQLTQWADTTDTTTHNTSTGNPT
jgi:hypothetical protein